MSDETRPETNEVPEEPVFVEDPALLKVRGQNGENKQYIKQLAHAIIIVMSKYGYANLRCVGASAVNNAVKAFTVASGEAKIRGLDLVLNSGFQSAMFDGVEKTAILFKVFNR
jgi:stage V sporulation protein SpoVS